MGRECSTNEEEEEGKKDIGGKARMKETAKKPRCKWLNNSKLYFREIGWGFMDWIDLAQYTDQWRVLVNTVMNL
jgi:hypothetical protein